MGAIQPNTDYMIVNYNSGKAWAVKGENRDPGASVVQYSWEIDPDQYNSGGTSSRRRTAGGSASRRNSTGSMRRSTRTGRLPTTTPE